MKTNLINKLGGKTRVILALPIFLLIMLGSINPANAGSFICKINKAADTPGLGAVADSLRAVVNSFNMSPLYQGCKNMELTADKVTLEKPVVFSGSTAVGSGLAFDGKKHIIDASNSAAKTADGCAVTILSSNVVISNLHLLQGGICVGSDDPKAAKVSNVHFVNVTVEASPGDGFKIASNSDTIVIDAGSRTIESTLYGVEFLGDMAAKGDNVFYNIDDSGVADEGSVSLFHDTKGAIKTGSYNDISIKNIVITQTTIRGQVVKCDDKNICQAAAAERVIMHRTNGGGNGGTGTTLIAEVKKVPLNGVFIISINKSLLSDKGDYISLIPVWSKADKSAVFGSATEPLQVKFDPTKVIDQVNTGIIGGGAGGGASGGATAVITLPDGTTKTIGSGGSLYGFKNYDECKIAMQQYGGNSKDTVLSYVDSDDDGIPDVREDRNHNCIRDPGETDWNNPDTDGDGIMDGEEDSDQKDGYINCYRKVESGAKDSITKTDPRDGLSYTVTELSVAKDSSGIPCAYQSDSFYLADGCSQNTNSIGKDGRPMGYNPVTDFCTETSPVKEGGSDTDGDGTPDGIELRTLKFNISDKSTLWNLNDKQQYGTYDDKGNFTPKTCDAGLIGRQAVKIQVIGTQIDADGKTVDAPPFFKWFVCTNSSVSPDKDTQSFTFSGKPSNGQTNPFNPDTDGDGYCDGSGGDGCATLKNAHQSPLEQDKCPNSPNTDNNCVQQCIPGGIFNRIKPDKLQSVKDAIAAFKTYADRANLEKVLADAYPSGVNPDLDGDKIPDIVEDPDGKCDFNSTDILSTNPYAKDSDGDNMDDQHDPCPNDPTNACLKVAATTGQGQCTKYVENDDFSSHKAMYCYLDWDSDGLYNCQENKDFNNKIDVDGTNYQNSETCPAVADTDGDGLDDFQEVQTWKTNPWAQDTDGDHITDGNEVIIDGKFRTPPIMSDSSPGCYTNLWNRTGNTLTQKFATDPLKKDTDGDGLNDDIEIAIGTNPVNPDSDGDGLCDGNQEVSGVDASHSCIKGEVLSSGGVFPYLPTNLPDTDFDTPAAKVFLNIGYKVDTLPNGRVITSSNPCDQDTDQDHKPDWIPGVGMDGGSGNNIDPVKLDRNPSATTPNAQGPDGDGDGIPDDIETNQLGTDPTKADSDGDGLEDGCVNFGTAKMRGELCEHFTSPTNANFIGLGKGVGKDFNPGMHDTDPMNPDTDSDGMKDGDELMYPDGNFKNPYQTDASGKQVYIGLYQEGVNLNPRNYDTDGDGILDGVEAGARFKPNANAKNFYCHLDGVQAVLSGGLANPGNPIFTQSQTYAAKGPNPLNDKGSGFDTDGDGLQDGNNNTYVGPGIGKAGEDLNCNGKVDFDANGNPSELNPILADTNSDGMPDGAAVCRNGICDVVSNLAYGYSRQVGSGCSNTLMPGETLPATAGDFATLAMFLAPLGAAVRMRLRRK